jgi:peptidoglycan hydrolase CwlO-like protein
MMCGKRFLILLLLLFFSFLLYSQESKPIEFPLFLNPWTDIDLTLQTLEEQTTDMQTLIEKQQKQIQNLENAYQSTFLLYLNSENNSKQLEADMKKCNQSLQTWRAVGISSLVVVVVTVAGMIIGVNVNDAR